MKIQKVSPVGLANIAAVATAFIVFIILLLLTVLGGILGGLIGDVAMLGGMAGGGIIMLILGPLIYGVLAWIFTLIYALILNLALKWIGGLQVDTSE
tara:strand:- start:638 stop:928 length:291 start_codon:yes stop_codon:yes gene_type:complete